MFELSQRAKQALRNDVRVVPQPIARVVQRHVQPSSHQGRGTHVPQLLLHDLPPQRVLLGGVHPLPRLERRRRLGLRSLPSRMFGIGFAPLHMDVQPQARVTRSVLDQLKVRCAPRDGVSLRR